MTAPTQVMLLLVLPSILHVLPTVQAIIAPHMRQWDTPLPCLDPVDLAIVVDTSRSVDAREWAKELDVIQRITSNLNVHINKTRVSLVEYSHNTHTLACFKEYLSNEELKAGILATKQTYRGSTETGKALQYLMSDVFTAECGVRKESSKIALVITDGKSNTPTETIEEAMKLEKSGVKLVTVGFGRGDDRKQLEHISEVTDQPTLCVGDIDLIVSQVTCHPVHHRSACEFDRLEPECEDPTKMIRVTKAFYGRDTESTMCMSGVHWAFLGKSICQSDTALSTMTTKCDFRDKCLIYVNQPDLTPDPCPGTLKYAEIEYICVDKPKVDPDLKSVIACDFKPLKLECNKGEIIKMSQATYGRQTSYVCSEGVNTHFTRNTSCYSHTAEETIGHKCEDKQECQMMVVPRVLEDPCAGTFKYAEVEYRCEAKDKIPEGVIRTVACDWKRMDLKCDPGKKIRLQKAEYGRQNSYVCSEKVNQFFLTNTECHSKTANVTISNMCEGKEACTVMVVPDVLADPCPGTFKYAQVDYTCEGPHDESEHNL